MQISRLLTLLSALIFGQNALALIGGTLANDKSYDAIGALGVAGESRVHCTATLIDPEWIVTAQHCIEGGSEEEPRQLKPRELEFKIGTNASKPRATIRLKKWIPAPKLGADQLDVAFAKLSRPVLAAEATPIGLATSLRSCAVNKYEIAGLGVTTTDGLGAEGDRKKASVAITATRGNAFLEFFKTKAAFEAYTRQYFPTVENVVDRYLQSADLVDGYTIHVWDPEGRRTLPVTPPKRELADSCYGDSGGPLIRLDHVGAMRVVGVISSGFPGAMSCTPIGTKIGIFGGEIIKLMNAEKIPFEF